MSLPFAIEFLLTLEGSGGGRLVIQSGTQIFIPIFPARLQLVVDIYPPPGTYAHIYYIMGFGSSMIPNAFHETIQIWGGKPVNHILSEDWLVREHVDSFVVETQNTPSNVIITNRTNLAQYFEHTLGYLVIQTEDIYEKCIKALSNAGSADCVRLLEMMMAAKGGA